MEVGASSSSVVVVAVVIVTVAVVIVVVVLTPPQSSPSPSSSSLPRPRSPTGEKMLVKWRLLEIGQDPVTVSETIRIPPHPYPPLFFFPQIFQGFLDPSDLPRRPRRRGWIRRETLARSPPNKSNSWSPVPPGDVDLRRAQRGPLGAAGASLLAARRRRRGAARGSDRPRRRGAARRRRGQGSPSDQARRADPRGEGQRFRPHGGRQGGHGQGWQKVMGLGRA